MTVSQKNNPIVRTETNYQIKMKQLILSEKNDLLTEMDQKIEHIHRVIDQTFNQNQK